MNMDNNDPHALLLAPSDNALLCQNVTMTTTTATDRATSSSAAASVYQDSVILVGRGQCTFETKAMNAQRLGASGVIIYGNLASRYSLNNTEKGPDHQYTTEDIVYPCQYNDYDCDKGRAEIPASAVEFTPLPYNSDKNDPLLSGDTPTNLCMAHAKDHLQSCASKACLLTGNTTANGSLEACCAWDLHVFLYHDSTFDSHDVNISALYITMEQGQRLLQVLEQGPVQVQLFERYRPQYNLSSILIWALGVFVAALAAYASSRDYLAVTNEIIKRREQSANNDDGKTALENGPDSSSLFSGAETVPLATHNLSPRSTWAQEETLELSVWHAFGFIILASSGLMILFVFRVSVSQQRNCCTRATISHPNLCCLEQIYNVVKVMYGIGCSRAIMEVIVSPLLKRLFVRFQIVNRVCCRTGTEDFGDITMVDVVAFVCSYALGISWLVFAFTVRHPESHAFFWIMQDIMGACMCIMFLSLIKLNSIRVASILLIVAFFYDIFFVFVTPLLFKGESVMITVATSGGPPKADPLWCEKYPNDHNCRGGDPLPMLLTVPRLDDYAGGASLLGLGDIVLPGLLLSFAARLDAAKQLRGIIGGGNGVTHSYTCPKHRFCRFCNGGYFPPLVVAYAVGLFMANAAVYLMDQGQPALLYLVPCCLGTMAFMAWTRNEMVGLWEGPGVLRYADSILYGDEQDMQTTEQQQQQVASAVPMEDEDNVSSNGSSIGGSLA